MLEAGKKAPQFQLPDQDGKPVALKDLSGRWVVLYFYPRDDTPGCTVEACEFTAAMPQFRDLDALIFGCSGDSAQAHGRFIQKYKLGISLLTDADRSVMKTYGAFGKKLLYGKPVEGVIRSTVLIAPDGTVAHHWATVKAAGHAEQVRAKLLELQGGAVPAAAPATKVAKTAGKTAPAKPAGKAKATTTKAPTTKTPAKKTAKKTAKK